MGLQRGQTAGIARYQMVRHDFVQRRRSGPIAENLLRDVGTVASKVS